MSSKTQNGFKAPIRPLGTSWREFTVGKRLTDARIEYYQKLGYYSPEFRKARREAWERKASKRRQRVGSFDIVNGRMIYNPD